MGAFAPPASDLAGDPSFTSTSTRFHSAHYDDRCTHARAAAVPSPGRLGLFIAEVRSRFAIHLASCQTLKSHRGLVARLAMGVPASGWFRPNMPILLIGLRQRILQLPNAVIGALSAVGPITSAERALTVAAAQSQAISLGQGDRAGGRQE